MPTEKQSAEEGLSSSPETDPMQDAQFEELTSEGGDGENQDQDEGVIEDNPEALTAQLMNLSQNLAMETSEYAKLMGLSVNPTFLHNIVSLYSTQIFHTIVFNLLEAQGVKFIDELIRDEQVD
jgi:hypothetical protein